LKLQRDNINHDPYGYSLRFVRKYPTDGALLPLLIIECNILTKFDWIQTVLKKIYGRICESLKFCEPTNGVAASGKHQFIQDECHRSQHVEDPVGIASLTSPVRRRWSDTSNQRLSQIASNKFVSKFGSTCRKKLTNHPAKRENFFYYRTLSSCSPWHILCEPILTCRNLEGRICMTQLSWIIPAILVCTLFFVTGESGNGRAAARRSWAFMMYDLELERSIRAKLDTDERLKAAIDVTAEAAKNEVTLSGAVASKAFRDKAIELAKSVHPGLVINDRIAVKPAA